MIVKTLFQHDGRYAEGEVEVKLLPGIPLLNVVGLPDQQIRECGLKLRSALRTCDLHWPVGNQVIVNLRPAHFRKTGAGVDLAITLAFLAYTGQLNGELREKLDSCLVYGELALNGRIFAPNDFPSALRAAKSMVITGHVGPSVREGNWLELESLTALHPKNIVRHFDWKAFWKEPSLEDIELHASAAEALVLSHHCQLNALVVGPQGTGKTTWARALYALSPAPEHDRMAELEEMFGEEVYARRWRPCEIPHHTITPLAMIGGGVPITPGLISRSHGGVLVMDEFLEFNPQVLEALREPVETGHVVIARRGERCTLPANFQLVATSNLCPCGRRDPGQPFDCSRPRFRCRVTLDRLSGPIVDRFDLVLFSHEWVKKGQRIPLPLIREKLKQVRRFRNGQESGPEQIPEWIRELALSHRRHRSLLRVARGLADLRGSPTVEDLDFREAYQKVVAPMEALRQLFA